MCGRSGFRGGGAYAQSYDSNPQNPQNWEVTFLHNGSDTGQRKEHLTPTGGPVIECNYAKVWNEPYWTRNGVSLGGVIPAKPFSQMVQEADTVTYGASGSRTIRFRWISPSPRPAQVRVWMRAVAWYYHNGTTGYGAASDGLGGTTLVTNEGGSSEGFQIVTLNVGQDGVATASVTQSATATQSSIYVGSVMMAVASVDAGCSLAGGIDARIVTITTENGGEALEPDYSNAVTANPNRSYTRMIDWWTWLVLSTENDPAYNYSVPSRRFAQVTFGANINIATWKIGIPAQLRKKTTVGTFWTQYEPEATPSHTFSFLGVASSQQSLGEWHQWNDTPVIHSHQIDHKSVTLPAPHVEDHKYYSAPGVLASRIVNNMPTTGTHQTISLVFGWRDGTTHTSIRHIFFCDEFRKIAELPYLVDDRCNQEPEIVPTQDKSVTEFHSTVVKPTFEALAVHLVSAVVTPAIDGFANPPGSVGDAFGIGAIKQYALGLFPSGVQSDTINKNDYMFALFQVPGVSSHFTSLPPGTTIEQFHWEVLGRPGARVHLEVMERYGSSGFLGVEVVPKIHHQSALRGPKLWRFTFSGGSSGTGQTGGNGGQGGSG